jgi:hypothetical protein
MTELLIIGRPVNYQILQILIEKGAVHTAPCFYNSGFLFTGFHSRGASPYHMP